MKPDIDVGGGDTLWAVVLGAFLATLGGFLATQAENWFGRRERHRSASLLFADVLTGLGYLIHLAQQAKGRGEPYGPITLRLLRAARREIDIYDRNRESLYDLKDADLRIRIHTLVVSITMPLEGLFDTIAEIKDEETRLPALKSGTVARRKCEARLEMLRDMRERAFEFVVDSGGQTKAMVDALTKAGRHARPQYGDGPRPSTVAAARDGGGLTAN